MCVCNKGYIEYWYDDFDTLSAKEKLAWLKFEYEDEYNKLTKEEKKDFIKYGYVCCPNCEGEAEANDSDEAYETYKDDQMRAENGW